MTHDYKCELDTGFNGTKYLDVFEDGNLVARFKIKGRFKKRLELLHSTRQMHNICNCHSCALEFFEHLQEECLI